MEGYAERLRLELVAGPVEETLEVVKGLPRVNC
jgi:hypothetical protein